jgi:cobalt-zinc-cadmium efflux system protein
MGHGHSHAGHGHGHGAAKPHRRKERGDEEPGRSEHGERRSRPSSERHDHRAPEDKSGRRALTAALALTASFMLVEVVVGFWTGSLALLADAGHMLNDAAALALSLVVAWIAMRPRTAKHTFGYRRAEVMGALMNAAALGVAGVLIVVEAAERLWAESGHVEGIPLLFTASLGLAINLVSAWILAARGGESINVRAALFHVLSDALGSIAAIVAGVLVLAFDLGYADPIASLAIACLILYGAFRLLRDTTHVLMEGAPEGIDVAALEKTIAETEGVAAVHDLHVWSLVPGEVLLSAHVVVKPGTHGTDVARLVGDRLASAHEIDHATIQPEAPEQAPISIRKKS